MCIFATDMKKLLYILVFFLLLASCTDDKEVMPVLERAEAYLPEYPDSAGMLLDSISSRPLGESGERVRALYGLLCTMTDAMTGKGVTTDSLIRPSYIYYKEQGESDGHTRRLGRSAFYLAQFEASRDSTKRAEDLYREAIRCSEKVEDWRMCYMAYSWFAREKTWSDKEEAIRLLKTAVGIYHKIEDKPANLVSMLLDLSINHIAFEHIDSALNYANQAYDIACSKNLESQQYTAKRRLAVIYYEIGDYPKALELAKQGMHGLTDQTRDAALFSLADCYLACDSLEQAKATLLQIDHTNVELGYSVNKALCRIAVLQNDFQHINIYFDSLETATVNLFSKIQQTKEAYYQDNLKKELSNMQLSQRKRQQVIILWGTIILIVVISVFALIIYHKNLKIACQKRVNSIMFRKDDNREFSIKVNKLAQDLKEKTERVSSLECDFETYKKESNEITKQQHLRFETLKSELDVHLKDGSTLLGQITNEDISVSMTDSSWKQLELYLNHYKNDFITLLRSHFHKMDELDIRICMLSLIGLSNSRMAELMNRDSSTIKRRKRHIKNHTFGLSDIDSDFQDIILSMYYRNNCY